VLKENAKINDETYLVKKSVLAARQHPPEEEAPAQVGVGAGLCNSQ
jgi:hypothetical protein